MKRIFWLQAIFVLVFVSGCSPTNFPAATENPAPPVVLTEVAGIDTVQPALYGVWMNDQKEVIVISEKSVYMVMAEDTSEPPQIRESFYEINSVDWVNGVVTMSLKWVRVNGEFGGFGEPLHYLKVNINDNDFYYSMGDEGQGIPAEAIEGPWHRN